MFTRSSPSRLRGLVKSQVTSIQQQKPFIGFRSLPGLDSPPREGQPSSEVNDPNAPPLPSPFPPVAAPEPQGFPSFAEAPASSSWDLMNAALAGQATGEGPGGEDLPLRAPLVVPMTSPHGDEGPPASRSEEEARLAKDKGCGGLGYGTSEAEEYGDLKTLTPEEVPLRQGGAVAPETTQPPTGLPQEGGGPDAPKTEPAADDATEATPTEIGSAAAPMPDQAQTPVAFHVGQELGIGCAEAGLGGLESSETQFVQPKALDGSVQPASFTGPQAPDSESPSAGLVEHGQAGQEAGAAGTAGTAGIGPGEGGRGGAATPGAAGPESDTGPDLNPMVASAVFLAIRAEVVRPQHGPREGSELADLVGGWDSAAVTPTMAVPAVLASPRNGNALNVQEAEMLFIGAGGAAGAAVRAEDPSSADMPSLGLEGAGVGAGEGLVGDVEGEGEGLSPQHGARAQNPGPPPAVPHLPPPHASTITFVPLPSSGILGGGVGQTKEAPSTPIPTAAKDGLGTAPAASEPSPGPGFHTPAPWLSSHVGPQGPVAEAARARTRELEKDFAHGEGMRFFGDGGQTEMVVMEEDEDSLTVFRHVPEPPHEAQVDEGHVGHVKRDPVAIGLAAAGPSAATGSGLAQEQSFGSIRDQGEQSHSPKAWGSAASLGRDGRDGTPPPVVPMVRRMSRRESGASLLGSMFEQGAGFTGAREPRAAPASGMGPNAGPGAYMVSHSQTAMSHKVRLLNPTPPTTPAVSTAVPGWGDSVAASRASRGGAAALAGGGVHRGGPVRRMTPSLSSMPRSDSTRTKEFLGKLDALKDAEGGSREGPFGSERDGQGLDGAGAGASVDRDAAGEGLGPQSPLLGLNSMSMASAGSGGERELLETVPEVPGSGGSVKINGLGLASSGRGAERATESPRPNSRAARYHYFEQRPAGNLAPAPPPTQALPRAAVEAGDATPQTGPQTPAAAAPAPFPRISYVPSPQNFEVPAVLGVTSAPIKKKKSRIGGLVSRILGRGEKANKGAAVAGSPGQQPPQGPALSPGSPATLSGPPWASPPVAPYSAPVGRTAAGMGAMSPPSRRVLFESPVAAGAVGPGQAAVAAGPSAAPAAVPIAAEYPSGPAAAAPAVVRNGSVRSVRFAADVKHNGAVEAGEIQPWSRPGGVGGGQRGAASDKPAAAPGTTRSRFAYVPMEQLTSA